MEEARQKGRGKGKGKDAGDAPRAGKGKGKSQPKAGKGSGQEQASATWRPRGLSKSVISRVTIRATPFRVLITLLITHLLSPLGLQVSASTPF